LPMELVTKAGPDAEQLFVEERHRRIAVANVAIKLTTVFPMVFVPAASFPMRLSKAYVNLATELRSIIESTGPPNTTRLARLTEVLADLDSERSAVVPMSDGGAAASSASTYAGVDRAHEHIEDASRDALRKAVETLLADSLAALKVIQVALDDVAGGVEGGISWKAGLDTTAPKKTLEHAVANLTEETGVKASALFKQLSEAGLSNPDKGARLPLINPDLPGACT